MLSRLFRGRVQGTPAGRGIPAGERVYAIGDVHGRLDLFDELLDLIDADMAARGVLSTTVILLGDLVDRGPDSRGVVERAMELRARAACGLRCIMGNHEEILLRLLDGDDRVARLFTRIGGEATARSYGLTTEQYHALEFEQLSSALIELIPRSHREFLATFEDVIAIGDYLFVHAGLRPNVPVDGQETTDLRWIRSEFLDHTGSFGPIVVHGHSISDQIEYRGNRIGLDTGAYATGRLSALGLEGADRWALQTG